ncbi:MAG: hypothetical protein HYT46_02865 [Candidatus Vogelbacteria bacterium]|nr:hypothetical protein [Candidatus Vogelbacteria bacterium]
MSKELIQDIKQPKRRLAEILPGGGRASEAASAAPVRRPRRRTTGWLIIVVLIILLPLVYFVSQTLAEAVVTVKPKQAILTLDDTLAVVARPVDAAVLTGAKIGYETMTVQATDSVAVTATEKKTVALRASGQITVFNRYSSRPQKLIANTRFEAPSGKIYRIKDEIIIPGYELVDSKLKPGEFVVTVYADKAGAEYNGEVKDLTIPGFKGEPRYDKITARGLTSMTGGFAGERLTIPDSVKDAAEKELSSRLESSLAEEARAGLPDGFVTFPETKFIKLQSRVKEGPADNGNLTLELDGELATLIFSRQELSRNLATRHLTDYDGAEVAIANFDELTVSLLDRGSFDPASSREARLNFTGEARVVWQFDLAVLKRALAGASKNDYQAIFLKFPSIASAEVSIQPPWLKRFPADPGKITIKVDQ